MVAMSLRPLAAIISAELEHLDYIQLKGSNRRVRNCGEFATVRVRQVASNGDFRRYHADKRGNSGSEA